MSLSSDDINYKVGSHLAYCTASLGPTLFLEQFVACSVSYCVVGRSWYIAHVAASPPA